MKKTMAIGSAAALALVAIGGSAYAQDAGDTDTDAGTDVETEAPESNGAIVTREDIVEEREVVDENGDPVVDENGVAVTETVTTGFVQTVETPSGNIHTITKENGSRAIVEHQRAERPEKAERVAKAERPERPERPEKPEKPERPEKPEKPEKPGRPG